MEGKKLVDALKAVFRTCMVQCGGVSGCMSVGRHVVERAPKTDTRVSRGRRRENYAGRTMNKV